MIKIIDLDVREKVLNMYFLEGKSYDYIAKELGVNRNTIHTWCRRYRERNNMPTRDKGFIVRKPITRENIQERKQVDQVSSEARIAKLEMEVELLRNFLILRKGE